MGLGLDWLPRQILQAVQESAQQPLDNTSVGATSFNNMYNILRLFQKDRKEE